MNEIEIYSEFADDYIKRFCNKNNAFAIDPFTGKEVDLLDYQFKSVLDFNNEQELTTRIPQVVEKNRKTLADW
jgi:hypothetical protein